jgi:hypothetical protein
METIDYLFWLRDKEDELMDQLSMFSPGDPKEEDIYDDIKEELAIVREIKAIVMRYKDDTRTC